MTMEKLKPCPFCGGKAKTIENVFSELFDVSCLNPFCYAHLASHEARYNDLDDSVEAWNRRTDDGK